MPATEPMVKVVGEGLEVDVGGVHGGEEVFPGAGIDIARGDGDVADAPGAAGVGGVDGILQEDHRVVVGIGHAATAQFGGATGDGLRRSAHGQGVNLTGFAHVPILTELAGEVTAGGPEGKDWGAGEKMIEGLLFDGIDAEAAGASVAGEDHRALVAGADEAEPGLALLDMTVAGAEVALDPAVIQPVPVAGGVIAKGWDHGIALLGRDLIAGLASRRREDFGPTLSIDGPGNPVRVVIDG